MKNKLVLGGAFAALIVIGGGGYWLGKNQAGNRSPQAVTGPAQQNVPKVGAPAPGVGGTGIAIDALRSRPVRMSQGLTAVGSLRSDESVTVRPEVAGSISEIAFREGQRVTKGATLIRFDTSVQRAELEQAEANLGLSKSSTRTFARPFHQRLHFGASTRRSREQL